MSENQFVLPGDVIICFRFSVTILRRCSVVRLRSPFRNIFSAIIKASSVLNAFSNFSDDALVPLLEF